MVLFWKQIEAENIWLHHQDGQSVLEWVDHLRKSGDLLAFKSSSDPPPPGSSLAPDTFALLIQTKYQRDVFHKHGHTFAGIDATHNTTHYENMSLFSVMVRDRWGHGMSQNMLYMNFLAQICLL